jgi:hypothetical protein
MVQYHFWWMAVIVASAEQGNGIIGVIDGYPPKGVEGNEDRAKMEEFVRRIGYKLQGHGLPFFISRRNNAAHSEVRR